jgi:hypothetical protein
VFFFSNARVKNLGKIFLCLRIPKKMMFPPIDRYSVSYVRFLDYCPQKYPGKLELLNGLLEEVHASEDVDSSAMWMFAQEVLPKFLQFRIDEIKRTHSDPMELMRCYEVLLAKRDDDWTSFRWELFDAVWRRCKRKLPQTMPDPVMDCKIVVSMWEDGYLVEGDTRWAYHNREYCRDAFLRGHKTLPQLCEWIANDVLRNGVDIMHTVNSSLRGSYYSLMWHDLCKKYDNDSKQLVQFCVQSLIEGQQLERLSRPKMEHTLFDLIRCRFGTASDEVVAYLELGAPSQDHTTRLPADVQFLIARRLPYKDIYSLSRTSKEWNLFDEKYNVMWATLSREKYPLKPPFTFPRGPVYWNHLFNYQETNSLKRIGVQRFFRPRFRNCVAKLVKFNDFGGKSKRAQVTAKEISDAWDTLMKPKRVKTRPLEPVNANGQQITPIRLIDVGPAGQTTLRGAVIELNSITNAVRDTAISFGFAEFIGGEASALDTRGLHE